MAKFDTTGAIGGAASGAQALSFLGPPGMIAGGIGGGLLGAFGRKKKKKPKRISTLDPTQQGIYDQYAKGLKGQGGQFNDLFNFDPEQARDVFSQMYAQPAYQQFQEGVVPKITGQFRGGNLQNSSYLGGALAKAGTDVQKDLNAQLSNMLYQGQQDSVNRRINGINNLLNMQTFAYQQPQAGASDNIFSALMEHGGKALANFASNGFGGGGSGGGGSGGGNSYSYSSSGGPGGSTSFQSSGRSPLPNFSFKP